LKGGADFTAGNIKLDERHTKFEVFRRGRSVTKVTLGVYGLHNVRNALAAVACGIELDMPVSVIRDALAEYRGVARRLEFKGEHAGVLFLDDYGHHPTEIAATIEALRMNYKRRVVVVFQPHRYTRTKLLYRRFGPAFKSAQVVRIMDIYAASEKPIKGVSSRLIIDQAKKYVRDVKGFKPDSDLRGLVGSLRKGDIFLTLGAGDVWKLHEQAMEEWKKIGKG